MHQLFFEIDSPTGRYCVDAHQLCGWQEVATSRANHSDVILYLQPTGIPNVSAEGGTTLPSTIRLTGPAARNWLANIRTLSNSGVIGYANMTSVSLGVTQTLQQGRQTGQTGQQTGQGAAPAPTPITGQGAATAGNTPVQASAPKKKRMRSRAKTTPRAPEKTLAANA